MTEVTKGLIAEKCKTTATEALNKIEEESLKLTKQEDLRETTKTGPTSVHKREWAVNA